MNFNHLSRFELADQQNKWVEVYERLNGFIELGENWDGEGASAPSEELIGSVENYLMTIRREQQIPAPDRIVVTTDGDLIVEWQTPDYIFEFESSSPGNGDWMFTPVDGEPTFFSVNWNTYSNSRFFTKDFSYNPPSSASTTWNPSIGAMVA
jgi:hypothetical protein